MHPLFMSKQPQSTALNIFQYCFILSNSRFFISVFMCLSLLLTLSNLFNQHISAVQVLRSPSFLIGKHFALYTRINL